ncbi:hypothetical protein [Chromatocurvus halotolerans]|nr:hypothetical protein [Chromatocurvus halotolerans]
MRELVAMSRAPSARDCKSRAELITPFSDFAKVKAAAEPAQFALLIVDHDDNRSLAEIKALYRAWGCGLLIYATAHHNWPKGDKPPAPRWWGVIPLSRAVDADAWLSMREALTALVGCDPAAARIQQGFYAPGLIGTCPKYTSLDATDRASPDSMDSDAPLLREIAVHLADKAGPATKGGARKQPHRKAPTMRLL